MVVVGGCGGVGLAMGGGGGGRKIGYLRRGTKVDGELGLSQSRWDLKISIRRAHIPPNTNFQQWD
jgi:hypothetical protein